MMERGVCIIELLTFTVFNMFKWYLVSSAIVFFLASERVSVCGLKSVSCTKINVDVVMEKSTSEPRNKPENATSIFPKKKKKEMFKWIEKHQHHHHQRKQRTYIKVARRYKNCSGSEINSTGAFVSCRNRLEKKKREQSNQRKQRVKIATNGAIYER